MMVFLELDVIIISYVRWAKLLDQATVPFYGKAIAMPSQGERCEVGVKIFLYLEQWNFGKHEEWIKIV